MHSIINIESDWHCGLHAITGLLGMSEYSWRDIRFILIGELQSFRAMYTQLYRSDMHVDELLHILYCFDDIAHCEHWMTLSDMGYLIALEYNVVLVHLSRIQCITHIPLRSIPHSAVQHMLITIGFVNDGHFV